jgi:hypothetical protein
MVEHRWLRTIGPGVIALSALVAVGWSTGEATGRPWAPLACAGGGTERIAAVRDRATLALADLGTAAWMRLDPRLDVDGALVGQRLWVGIHERGSARVMDLPAESFAAGPFGRVVLVGADDGRTSSLFTVDVATGCTSSVAQEADVIRRATISPAGDMVFESRVDRTSRADLGIWRRPLDASRSASRVIDPLPADTRFGRTWSTEFAWSVDGEALAVQSCGDLACRTRVVATDTGAARVRLLDDPALGPLVGVAGTRLVTYEACRGLPCPIVAVDIDSGARTPLSGAAGFAVLTAPDGEPRLVHEADGTSGRHLRAVSPDGRNASDLGPIPTTLRLTPDGPRSGTGTRLPTGWVLLSPEGRLPLDADSSGPRLTLRHVPDGRSVLLDEVTR